MERFQLDESALSQNPKTKSCNIRSVAIIGMGYVGLPFLIEKAKVGLEVLGLENNLEKLQKLKEGLSYIDDIKSSDLKEISELKKVTFSNDSSLLIASDVIVICVPTPLDKNQVPDLSYIKQACHEIAKFLQPGQLISLESTTYPGTTEEIIKPILETSGLRCGEDFYLAYSPERVDPGNTSYKTYNTNKVVGADDEKSLKRAIEFYKMAIKEIIPVKSTRIAEMVKIYENTFRAVNLALVNQMTQLCDRMNINVWEMLEAAFTKPFGIMPFYPGPGVGGHCVPVDPHYLEWKAKEYNFDTSLIATAGEINRSMPNYVCERVIKILNNQGKALRNCKIIFLGLSYKENISDARESAAIKIWEKLSSYCGNISYHDSYLPMIKINQQEYHSQDLTNLFLEENDLIIITIKHKTTDFEQVKKHSKLIFDCRNVYAGNLADHIISL